MIDRESRTLSEDDLLCLQDLALMVENELGLTLLAERNQEYTNRLEETISQRTLELVEKNRQLEQQHADRLRIQKTLTSVFETVREGLLVIDGSGSVVLANAEARNIWQYESESLVDQNIATLVQGFDNGSSLDLHNRSQQGFHGSIIDPSAERERPRSMVDRFKSVGVRKTARRSHLTSPLRKP